MDTNNINKKLTDEFLSDAASNEHLIVNLAKLVSGVLETLASFVKIAFYGVDDSQSGLAPSNDGMTAVIVDQLHHVNRSGHRKKR